MYRADRPLGITLSAILYIIPGLWMILSGLFVVPAGFCLVLCLPGLFAQGVWALLTGTWELIFGLALWTGHNSMRLLRKAGPAGVLILNALSGLMGNGWSPLIVLLSLVMLWYLRTPEATQFFRLDS